MGFIKLFILEIKITVGNKINWNFYLKLFLVVIQIGFQIGLILVFNNDIGIIKLSLIFNSIATMVALGIHYLEQFKSTIPNGVLLFYWLFQVILNLARIGNLYLRNSFGKNNDKGFANLVILSTINAFIILIVEILFPIQPLNNYYHRVSLKESPLDQANVFSRITFDWMGGLMKKGIINI